jgi:hypothetical protein
MRDESVIEPVGAGGTRALAAAEQRHLTVFRPSR